MDIRIPIISFFNYWISWILIAWFACIYSNKKMNCKNAVILGLICATFTLIADILLFGNYHLLFLKVIGITIVGSVCLSIFIKTSPLKESLIIMMIMFIIVLPIDYIAIQIFHTEEDTNVLMNNFNFMAFKRVLLNIYLFFLFVVYKLIKKKYNITMSLKKRDQINFFILLLITLYLIYLNYQLLLNANSKISILNMVILLLFLVVVVFSTGKIFKLNKKEMEIRIKDLELENQRLYNKALETIVDNARQVQHNYDNTLASIKGYLCIGDYNGLESYVNNMIEDNEKMSTIRTFAGSRMKNAGVMGIILKKIKYANDNDVIFKFNIQNELENINASIFEISNILGILLDNAIEAANESKDKFIKLEITKVLNIISFIVVNSYKDKPDKKEMFKKGFSTKGDERGNGLFYVREIINNQDRFILNTFIENNLVRQDFIIDNCPVTVK